MKLKHTRNSFNSLILIALIFLAACSSKPRETQEAATSNPEVIPESVNTSKSNFYYINSPANESLAEIAMDGDNITVTMAGGNLFGKLKGEKRKYYDQNNQFKYAVKLKGAESFKLRDLNEELLWKVKLYEDKVKISNTEEMTDSYTIRLNENNKIKLKRNDEEVASIRIVPNDPFASVQDKYTVRNFGKSLALGVLLISEIPEQEKYLLCTELLERGR